jgi:hypothetical protein
MYTEIASIFAAKKKKNRSAVNEIKEHLAWRLYKGKVNRMTPNEMIAKCDQQIEISGDKASVGFVIPGRWGKSNTRRLWPKGPVGEIVQDFGNGTIYVMYDAQKVKRAVLEAIQGEDTQP